MPEPDEKHLTFADSVRREVRIKVREMHTSGDFKKLIVEHLVESEIEELTQVMVKALHKRKELSKELARMYPDHALYDNESKKIPGSEGFTKERAEERKRLLAEGEKLDTAIAKAVENGDYESIRNIIKS